MAIQEEMAKIAEHADDDTDEGGDENATERRTSWTERLVELVGLCRAGSFFPFIHQAFGGGDSESLILAIPRLRLRKSSASETLHSPLSELRRTVEAVSLHAQSGEARDLMIAVHTMVIRISSWVKDLPAIEPEEVAKCQVGAYILPYIHLFTRPFRSRHSSG